MLYANEAYDLNEIVVSSTKTKSTLADLPMQVTVITQDEIENSGATNISDILTGSGEVATKASGANEQQVSIRGMNPDDTLYLIDGKRINGTFTDAGRIPASMVERIEIVKGSSGLLYGSDSMGGIINIITKKSDDDFAGDIQVTHAKNKNSADINIFGKKENTSFRLFSSYIKRDTYSKDKTTDVIIKQGSNSYSPSTLPASLKTSTNLDNLNDTYDFQEDYEDEMETKSISGGMTHRFSDHFKIDIDMSYLKENIEGNFISALYTTNYDKIVVNNLSAEQYDENRRVTASSGFTYTPSDALEFMYSLSYSKYEKDKKIYTNFWEELGYDSKEDSVSGIDDSTTRYVNHDFLSTYEFSQDNRVLIGGEYRVVNRDATGYSIDDRTYSGIFLQHEYRPIKRLNLVYGARYDKDSEAKSETSLSFGAVYDIYENTKVKANYSEGFKSATDEELYTNTTTAAGKNLLGSMIIEGSKTQSWDLTPETSETIEIGISNKGDVYDFEVSVFDTKIDNRISKVILDATTTSYKNISESEIKGVETNIAFYPVDELIVKFYYSYIDAKNKTDDTALIGIPEELASMTISYFPMPKLELRSVTKYTGEQIDIDGEVGGYSITNIKVMQKDSFKNIDLFAGIDNVFDKKIPEQLGYIQKSNYYIGAKYKF
jgi:outer membrane receptor for ferrienterochelin and colicins